MCTGHIMSPFDPYPVIYCKAMTNPKRQSCNYQTSFLFVFEPEIKQEAHVVLSSFSARVGSILANFIWLMWHLCWGLQRWPNTPTYFFSFLLCGSGDDHLDMQDLFVALLLSLSGLIIACCWTILSFFFKAFWKKYPKVTLFRVFVAVMTNLIGRL